MAMTTFLEEDNPKHQIWITINIYVDLMFNFIFIWEYCTKSIVLGLAIDKGSFLRDSWNQLDFIVVATSILEMLGELGLVSGGSGLAILKILKMLRVLRPLRFISHQKNLKLIVNSLIGSLTGILNVTIVIVMVFMMFSILGVFLFSGKMGYCKGLDRAD